VPPCKDPTVREKEKVVIAIYTHSTDKDEITTKMKEKTINCRYDIKKRWTTSDWIGLFSFHSSVNAYHCIGILGHEFRATAGSYYTRVET